MDLDELIRGARQLWDNKPGVVILLILFFILLVLLIIDTWRHRNRHRRKRPQ